jgi:hypothetical protein
MKNNRRTLEEQPYTAELRTGFLADTIQADQLIRVNKDDILILRLKVKCRNEDMSRLQKEISERTGMKVILLDSYIELIGVAGTDYGCHDKC